MASKTSFFFQALNFGTEAELPTPPGKPRATCMIRSGSGYGSGFSRTTLITEEMAVLAPMPRASAATAMAVKPGLLRNTRKACRRSASRFSMPGLRHTQPNSSIISCGAGWQPAGRLLIGLYAQSTSIYINISGLSRHSPDAENDGLHPRRNAGRHHRVYLISDPTRRQTAIRYSGRLASDGYRRLGGRGGCSARHGHSVARRIVDRPQSVQIQKNRGAPRRRVAGRHDAIVRQQSRSLIRRIIDYKEARRIIGDGKKV